MEQQDVGYGRLGYKKRSFITEAPLSWRCVRDSNS